MKSLTSRAIAFGLVATLASCGGSDNLLPQIPITKAIDKSLPSITNTFQQNTVSIPRIPSDRAPEILNNIGENSNTIRPGDIFQAKAFLKNGENGVEFKERGLYVQINNQWHQVVFWGENFSPTSMKERQALRLLNSTDEDLIIIKNKGPISPTNMTRMVFQSGKILEVGEFSDKSITPQIQNKPPKKAPKKTPKIFCRSTDLACQNQIPIFRSLSFNLPAKFLPSAPHAPPVSLYEFRALG